MEDALRVAAELREHAAAARVTLERVALSVAWLVGSSSTRGVLSAREVASRIVTAWFFMMAVAAIPGGGAAQGPNNAVASAAAAAVVVAFAVEFAVVPRILAAAAPFQHHLVPPPPSPRDHDHEAESSHWVCPPRFVCVSATSLLRGWEGGEVGGSGDEGKDTGEEEQQRRRRRRGAGGNDAVRSTVLRLLASFIGDDVVLEVSPSDWIWRGAVAALACWTARWGVRGSALCHYLT